MKFSDDPIVRVSAVVILIALWILWRFGLGPQSWGRDNPEESGKDPGNITPSNGE